MQCLTIEVHLDGAWHIAATVEIADPNRGIEGRAVTAYDSDYIFDKLLAFSMQVATDRRALSIASPASLENVYHNQWPSWLLDLMPQGIARDRIAVQVGLARNDPALDIALLLHAGGAPIGNLRIKEAHDLERERLEGVVCPPLTDADIATRSETFDDVVNRFALLAAGSSGVQGEWPKALLTRSVADHCWYPDPFVPTDEGVEHIIVKRLKSSRDDDRLILESEAPYMEVAKLFGLNVHSSLTYHDGVLIIPRFDRELRDEAVLLHGQESMVSAMGISTFAHVSTHENYLRVLQNNSDDPVEDTLEYVLRDVLNFAMGNPDNHGRNTALTKPADGGVRLAPLFDFPPMRLSNVGIGRATRWACLQGQDLDGGWGKVCKSARFDGLPAKTISEALRAKIPFLQDLEGIARQAGVPDTVIAQAINGSRVAAAIERMEQ